MANQSAQLFGVRLTEASKHVTVNAAGIIEIMEHMKVALELFGRGFRNGTSFVLTKEKQVPGTECLNTMFQGVSFPLKMKQESEFVGNAFVPENLLDTYLDGEGNSKGTYYFCMKSLSGSEVFIHQGTDNAVTLEVSAFPLPMWLMWMFVCCLVIMSGIFSGLNLGLMSLNVTELQVIEKCGTASEKMYAKRIIPVRKRGNYLLCTLLLGNVLVNTAISILMEELTDGVTSLLASTTVIFLVGEIIPQSLCTQRGLCIGGNLIWFIKIFMLLFFPIAFPMGQILDRLFGKDVGVAYNKERLDSLIKVVNDQEGSDIDQIEADIVTGALRFSRLTIASIMTPLRNCFMLSIDTILDFDMMYKIRQLGFTRIPVYEGARENIVHLLFARDLLFVDPADELPLVMICEFYQNDVVFVLKNMKLNVVFREFLYGDQGHLAFVQEEGKNGYETVGIVTFEDVIEKIIQRQIYDETDTAAHRAKRKFEFSLEIEQKPIVANQIQEEAEMETLTILENASDILFETYQYLSTSVDEFQLPYVSLAALKKLLSITHIRKCDKNFELISKKRGDHSTFILVLDGTTEVDIGDPTYALQCGPFTYFGTNLLTENAGVFRYLREMGKANIREIQQALRHHHIQRTGRATTVHRTKSSLQIVRPRVKIKSYVVKSISELIYIRIPRMSYYRAVYSTLKNDEHYFPHNHVTDDEVLSTLNNHEFHPGDFGPNQDVQHINENRPRNRTMSSPTSKAVGNFTSTKRKSSRFKSMLKSGSAHSSRETDPPSRPYGGLIYGKEKKHANVSQEDEKIFTSMREKELSDFENEEEDNDDNK